MRKIKFPKLVVFLMVGVLLLLSSNTQAGLVAFSSDAFNTWDASGARVLQSISGPVDLIVFAESESPFTMTLTHTNDSDFDWTGFILTLDDPLGVANFVEGTAGSTRFETVVYDPYRLEFWAPEIVLIGEVVTLQFDIDVPSDDLYYICLGQQPIPEPATIALLGLGGLLLLRRRK